MPPQYMALFALCVYQKHLCVRLLGYIVGASPPLCVHLIGKTVGAIPPRVCPYIGTQSLLDDDLRWKTTCSERRASVDPCMLPTPLCGIFPLCLGKKKYVSLRLQYYICS